MNIVFWCLMPLVLPQALWARRRIPRFRAPDGPLEGRVGDVAGCRIVGFGDSIIAGVGAPETAQTITAQLARSWSEATGQGVRWAATGRIGATTPKIASLATRLEPDTDVRLVLVSAGVNDLTTLTRASRWLRALDGLCDVLRQRFPAARIVLLGIPPLGHFPALPPPLRGVLGLRARYFDRRVRAHVEGRRHVSYVPIDRTPRVEEFSADGFHPSAAGYATLAEAITRAGLEAGPG